MTYEIKLCPKCGQQTDRWCYEHDVLIAGERIEVVPAADLRGAVETLRWIADAVPDEDEGVRPLDDLLDRIQGEARLVLDGLDVTGGQ